MEIDFKLEPGRYVLERGLIKTGDPLVSIITPFYNAGKYFRQTFNCMMNQTFPFFEWIIVNDGSTQMDDVKYLESLAKTDPRVRVLYKENGGPASARNLAIHNTQTEIIIMLDADDLVETTYVEELFWGLFYHPQASWSYTNSVGFHQQEYIWNKFFDAGLMCTENYLCNSAAFRKKALLEAGFYSINDKYYDEDWHLWLKLLSLSKFPVKLATYSFWYRRLNTGALSITRQDPKRRAQSEHIIAQAAKSVNINVTAVQYPHPENGNRYDIPKISGWDKPFFAKNNKLHVLMILPWMVMGGADKFNLDIVRGINKNRFDIGIITTLPSENGWQQMFREHVADVFNLPDFLDMKNWAEFISYYIKSREVNVLFLSNSDYGYSLLPWLRREFPELTIIDYVHMTEWYWRNGGFTRISVQMAEFLDKTYVCNNMTRDDAVSFGRDPQSVETLYIGVHHEIFDPATVNPGFMCRMLKISADRPIVLFPCRIHPQKRPFLMLEIAKELKKHITDVAFVVVGDGPQLEELINKSEQYGLSETVYFSGSQEDVAPFYRDSDVTLICSIKEGLSLTAYESLSMGVPVVSADVGGQAELIDSEVGAIVPLMQDEAKDLDSRYFSAVEVRLYVEALMDILINTKKLAALRVACRERIVSGFSTAIMLDKLQNALQTIAADKDKRQRRLRKTKATRELGNIAEIIAIYYAELQIYNMVPSYAVQSIAEAVTPPSNPTSQGGDLQFKNELLRMANSRLGRFLLKIVFKLRLNKLFK